MLEAPKKKEIFRQVALDRLSSPEQLDTLMQVTSPRSWIALAGLGLLLAAVVTWSIVGTIPTKVQAQGVLIRPGGIFDVYAPGSGQIAELLVAEDATVAVDQVIARIAQPALELEIASARKQLAELRAQQQVLERFASRDLSLRSDSDLARQAKLKDTIAFAEQRLTSLREQLTSEEALLDRGLITRQTLLQTRQAIYATEDLLEGARNDLKQLPIVELTTRSQSEQNILQGELRINQAERQLEQLEQRLAEASLVKSPYAGRVIEIKRDEGAIVGVGTALVSLELTGKESHVLQVIAYLPSSQGKDVQEGMTVQVSPTTAPREEYGFLTGAVSFVSDFPATPDGMLRVLGNPTLVQGLAAGGPPFAAYIDLDTDPASVSGYHWSSFKGNEVPVNSGMMCVVSITVRERRPIEMVIPMLQQALGL
ncbi:MAG: NHLP bacteriocin system secretion protein [Vicinamibacterales bacterium]